MRVKNGKLVERARLVVVQTTEVRGCRHIDALGADFAWTGSDFDLQLVEQVHIWLRDVLRTSGLGCMARLVMTDRDVELSHAAGDRRRAAREARSDRQQVEALVVVEVPQFARAETVGKGVVILDREAVAAKCPARPSAGVAELIAISKMVWPRT